VSAVEIVPRHRLGRVARTREGLLDLLAFGRAQALSCAFAVAIFAGLAVTRVVDVGVPRYDALLIWCVLVQVVLVATRLETRDELLVIGVFHVLGLGLEVFKVAVGSWSYPEPGVLRLGDVPLYSGFMYAAVASYICQAWRRLDLRVDPVPMVATMAVAVGFYVNFFTNHWITDLRWVLLGVAAVLIARRSVTFRVRGVDRRMPLLVSFALIGLFIWVAENVATLLGAWTYASQAGGWSLVHPSKIGSWMVLVIFSFMLVLWLKQRKGGTTAQAASGA
jgi:uncharacterized membrane protein YoaT (DUF817 family)